MKAATALFLALMLLSGSLLRAAETTVSLERAIALAIARNPTVLQAQEEIKVKRGMELVVKSAIFPSLKLSGNFTHEQKSRFEALGGFARPQENTFDLGLRITQTVYEGGRFSANLKITRLQQEEAVSAFQTAIQDLVLAVKRSYYEAQRAKALIAVAEQQIALLAQEEADQKQRVKAGSAPQFNALRAGVELANARPALSSAKNNYRVSLAELAKLMAEPVPKSVPIPWHVVSSLEVRPVNFDLALSIDMAARARGELTALRTRAGAAEAQLKLLDADLRPSLSVFGGYDFLGARFSETQDNYNGAIVGIQGEWKIFDFGLTKGRKIQQAARIRQAELTLEETAAQIELDVRKAHSKFTESQELLLTQKGTVKLAEEALRLAQNRLNAGAGTQLDVLGSQTGLNAARTNELQARANYNVAVAELQRATGTIILFR